MLKNEIKFKTIKVSQKGQIAIPADIRKEVGIKRGDELLLVRRGDKLLIEKSSEVSKRFTREFDYMLKHAEKVAKRLWENKEDEIWDKL
ncbi:MAG: AbrB/MazE/SpoVT family DNA-binding domain-containing protein [Candidatus Aenigmarchaeota archaeon]|nr:AbrB/MazE/SpoVT family DNA-binding domain-containing protein [Candidatus Aenigmarchaeota archaeon]